MVIMVVPQLLKRNYKKLPYAGAPLGLSIVPWLLSLLDVKVDALTVFLYQTVIYMGAMLGSGYKNYDLFPWWDRVLHLFSGIMFFGYGVSFAKMVPEVRLAGTLIFSFALSLALHVIWEVVEFIIDSISHSDHQHWQKRSPIDNHQPTKAVQPPGLVDTMVDTIAGIVGALVACLGWWIYLAWIS